MLRLIVFEGTSGTGKSTLCELTTQYIESLGIPVKKAKHPTLYLREKIQEARYLDERDPFLEAQLFAADFRNFVVSDMEKNPDSIYVCDRSYITSLADSQHSGLTTEEIMKLNRYNPKPDLLFILECRPEIAMERIKKRSVETGKPISKRETVEYLGKLGDKYKLIQRHFCGAIYLDTEIEREKLMKTVKLHVDEARR